MEVNPCGNAEEKQQGQTLCRRPSRRPDTSVKVTQISGVIVGSSAERGNVVGASTSPSVRHTSMAAHNPGFSGVLPLGSSWSDIAPPIPIAPRTRLSIPGRARYERLLPECLPRRRGFLRDLGPLPEVRRCNKMDSEDLARGGARAQHRFSRSVRSTFPLRAHPVLLVAERVRRSPRTWRSSTHLEYHRASTHGDLLLRPERHVATSMTLFGGCVLSALARRATSGIVRQRLLDYWYSTTSPRTDSAFAGGSGRRVRPTTPDTGRSPATSGSRAGVGAGIDGGAVTAQSRSGSMGATID